MRILFYISAHNNTDFNEELIFMIDKSYYKNMPAKNTLNDDNNIHTNDYYTSLEDIPLENMIINSNLENESIIK